LRAALLRDAALRLRAALVACRDSAVLDAAARPSRFNAPRTALDRVADGFLWDRPFSRSRVALSRVPAGAVPLAVGGSFTP
jgi:hypothetical protein